MASHKSHTVLPSGPELQAPPAQRRPSTRLPPRSTASTTYSKPGTAPPTAKLLKKRPTRDNENGQPTPSKHLGTPRNRAQQPQHTERPMNRNDQLAPPSTHIPLATHPRPVAPSVGGRSVRYDGIASTRTPSLISGSSLSEVDSPRSARLRRKPSSIGRPTAHGHPSSIASQEDERHMRHIPRTYVDPFADSVLGISLPQPTIATSHKGASQTHPSALEMPHNLETDNLSPPTPHYATSATPSTTYSESPTGFSHVSTPTSISSYSPGITSTHKTIPRSRQMSPMQSRPPVVRKSTDESQHREREGLPLVRESSASSSSASTVLATNVRPHTKAPAKGSRLSLLPSTTQTSLQKPIERRGSTSRRTSATSDVQAPPELAHLAVDAEPRRLMIGRPSRPSREGAPELSGMRQQSPIIQSNMASLPSHRRNSSTDSKSTPSLSYSKTVSPAIDSPGFPSHISRIPTSRGPTPEIQSDSEKMAIQARSVTAPSPVKSVKSGSRFGFFKRNKTDPSEAPAKQEKKLLRKGPMAGTGHEGYGKYATRGRSGSTTSNAGSIGRTASQDSTNGRTQRTPSSRKSSLSSQKDDELDDYFRERLAPVIIRGGSAELCYSPDGIRSTSSLDSAVDDVVSAGAESSTSYVAIGSSRAREAAHSKPTLLPSAMADGRGASPMKRFGFGFRRPSESDEERKSGAMRPSNVRRSVQSTSAPGKSATLAPQPEPSKAQRPSASRTASHSKVDPSEGKEGTWLKSKKSESTREQQPHSQPKLARKWNFFQRSAQPQRETPGGNAHAVHVPSSRSVPHYALMNGGEIDLDDIEQIMEEAANSPEKPRDVPTPSPEIPSAPTHEINNVNVRKGAKHVDSILLPSPPLLPAGFASSERPASPQVRLRKENLVDLTPPPPKSAEPDAPPERIEAEHEPVKPVQKVPAPRPTRLVPLGRIPPVVSRRDRDVKLSDQSFSRPFPPTQPLPSIKPSRTSVESIQVSLAVDNTVLTDAFPIGLGKPFNEPNMGSLPLSYAQHQHGDEFLAFPPRKNSEQSCSSSSGVWSFAYPTTVASPPGAPLSEDEIWNEYDDLIDDVLSPGDQSVNSPFARQQKSPGAVQPNNSLEASDDIPFRVSMDMIRSAHTSISSHPQSIHLRRSRLLSVLHAGSPKSQTYPSVSDLYSMYGERGISIVDPATGRLSLQATKRDDNTSRPASTRSSLPASVGVAARQSRSTVGSTEERRVSSRYRDSKLIERAENEKDGLETMANLRFGALMTSKWLSFGRVLFSPVHFDLKDNTEDRVLVVDGLGKDWSYYCALTYPEATIFNLNPGTETANPGTAWSNVPNHKHVSHSDMLTMFPFPKRYFAAVVYRFPVAASEATYKNCIAECKRVLRPGGYLELSILDIDLINMGNRARRAVRGLKMDISADEPEVSLKPVGDMVMRLIGRKNFENINRCMVAVPVAAGRVTSWSSDSSGGDEPSCKQALQVNGMVHVQDPKKSPNSKRKKRMSRLRAPAPNFTDLLGAPPSPDPAIANEANANIGDMVARVGRWWYSRCYEGISLPEGDLSESLWNNGSLLRECESRGTSFRLLVAYAQKPACAVRRTVSV
ncbi:hypothetical protein EJ05DRAFT_502020 [Pseudovirgaria hyperparasitica]|uniref:Uncharacterized protein n=1 Tax=Pseudovirgaria hyperparasitica TaxID=470096 RepID=A0A6A6W1T8_9PEZI|nr:uncharacterized protein EJ05DRAFT_502020 [Pseudovirgaria hyperparasitica]KAF2756513.1 hypothetical protein EJ05DRAFT_502020 [Pseudovirgaria hyperparasitica]